MRQKNTIMTRYGNISFEAETEVLFSESSAKLTELKSGEYAPEFIYVVRQEDIETGEVKHVLYIKIDGKLYATISPTFLDSALTLIDWADDGGHKVETIKISRKQSKKGREFMICEPGKVIAGE